jgi:protein-S-isoprenylcysteine O-methyltransferase Ste14
MAESDKGDESPVSGKSGARWRELAQICGLISALCPLVFGRLLFVSEPTKPQVLLTTFGLLLFAASLACAVFCWRRAGTQR